MNARTPDLAQLRTAPELSTLGALSSAIDAAIGALQAAHPGLYFDEDDNLESFHLTDPALLLAAERVIYCAEALDGSMSWYRSETLPQEPKPSPFGH